MGVTKSWKCSVCGVVVKGEQPPEKCPVCGVGPDQFEAVEIGEVSFRSYQQDKIVIIGNGIAGLSACEAIRRRNAECSVEMISQENVITYNRPMLTKGILQELDLETFFVRDFAWYKQNNVKLSLGKRVTEIHPEKKELVLEDIAGNDGREKRLYDKLIIATGAECNQPPVPGWKNTGVFTIRKLMDVNEIRDYLPKVNHVVIVGGGVLGMEAAWEFAKSGKQITVLERSDRVMKNQLDEISSAMLQKAAEENHVKIALRAEVDSILGDGSCTAVRLKDGVEIPADLIVFSAGNKPNSQIGLEWGLEGDSSGRFIAVNENMETSAKDIYACGDMAAYQGVCIGIWNQAMEMGNVAGANAVGDSLKYVPVTPSNSYQGMGISLFSIGDIGRKEDMSYETIEKKDAASGFYQKLFFLDGKFCGGILFGDVGLTNWMIDCFEKKARIEEMRKILEEKPENFVK